MKGLSTAIIDYFQFILRLSEIRLDVKSGQGLVCATMIRINVQGPAKAVGIENANQLTRKLNCSPATGSDLWNERVVSIHFDTLDKLCQVFAVGVDSILVKGVRRGKKAKS